MTRVTGYDNWVQFLDRTLLRLADPGERTEVFSPALGDRLLNAAFVFQNVEVGDVTGVSVRDVDLLPSVTERQLVEGAVIYPPTGARWEGTASVGVAAPHAVVDARVELFLTTETRIADTSIESVELAQVGAVGEAVEYQVDVGLVIDGTLPSRIANHRVITGVRIEEDPVARLHAVVDEIQVARTLMAAATEVARVPSGMEARTGLPFVLVFAEAALDDEDLPFPAGTSPTGAAAQRSARLTELQTRLTAFGIALAPLPADP